MLTHVCLVSRQPLPNVLGALALRPRHAVLLTTQEEREVGARLQTWLEERGVWCSSRTLTDRLEARCARLGIAYVDAIHLQRLAEQARGLMRLDS